MRSLAYNPWELRIAQRPGSWTASLMFRLRLIPGRNEPGTGDIDYPHVFEFLNRSNYAGWIGCEYTPTTSTEDSLQWLRSLKQS